MTVETFIQTYGYAAVLVGTLFEGETVLIIGGFFAHRGYLQLPWVITAAFFGALMGDQLFFFIGRYESKKFLQKHLSWKIRIRKAEALLRKYRTSLILIFRFIYGIRTVTPFAIGMSRISKTRFILLDTIGAFVWAVVIGTAGSLFGNVLHSMLGDLRRFELRILSGIALTGGIVWILYFLRRRRNSI